MTDAVRRRAEACFAVARSATIPGERAAAINRGTAIVEGAGLSLDDFDVPGRTKARKPTPDARLIGGGPFSGFTYVVIGGDEMLDAVMDEIWRRQSRRSR